MFKECYQICPQHDLLVLEAHWFLYNSYSTKPNEPINQLIVSEQDFLLIFYSTPNSFLDWIFRRSLVCYKHMATNFGSCNTLLTSIKPLLSTVQYKVNQPVCVLPLPEFKTYKHAKQISCWLYFSKKTTYPKHAATLRLQTLNQVPDKNKRFT